MLELLLTWLTHSTLALGVAALCSSIRVPAAVCDAVWRAAVIMPFVTSALMMLGIEPAGTSVTIASPLEFTAQVVPLAEASSKSSSLLLLAWLASAIVGVARWAAEHRALSLWLQTAQPAPAAIQQLAASIAHRAGQRRRMRVLSTPHATSPLAAGSNTVLLPDRALAMDEAQLRGILGHEIAHLSRRDPQWRSMMSMLIALLPFQPLLRMARRTQFRLAEPLCDSLSVQWGADPRQLARSLHDIAQWQQSVQPRYAAAMAASGSGLVPRVEHLIRGGHAARTGLRRLGCGVSAGLSLVFMHSVPAIQAGMPTILGTLPREAITAGVQAGLPAFHACQKDSQEGTVSVRFTIRADGGVGRATIKESTLQAPALEQCLLEQVELLRFPPPDGGGIVIVHYPFQFTAS